MLCTPLLDQSAWYLFHACDIPPVSFLSDLFLSNGIVHTGGGFGLVVYLVVNSWTR